jgi:hypothetical protein
MKKLISIILFCMAMSFAQTTNQNQSTVASPQTSNGTKGEATVRGCISKSNSNFILMQTDPGNSYQLQASKQVKLGKYLGQEVEVTGEESASMPNSSRRSASPVTITVRSIKSLQKKCSN